MPHTDILPAGEPYHLPGGPKACLLIHGFTNSPEESRPLGEDLHQLGYTVLGVRLAGHGTHPSDLEHVRAEDWMADVENGLALLKETCQDVVLIGQSLGGCLALACGARAEISGVVAISTPYPPPISPASLFFRYLIPLVQPTTKKPNREPHPTLGIRREADYPAYTQFPTRVLRELYKTQEIMAQRLGEVDVPVLMLQSRDDPFILPEEPPRILEELGCQKKELVWLEGYGHDLTYQDNREEVLQIITDFLAGLP